MNRKAALSTALLTAILSSVPAFVGCERSSSPESEAAAPPTASAPEAAAETASAPSSPTESAASSESASAAASALGRATSQFVDVFTEEDETESAASDGGASASGEESTGGGDFSLVDEETRRKYTEDRTLVAPTLADRDETVAAAPKYRLEYKFPANTNLAWTVVHLVRKRVSYGGTEKLIETSSTTERRWEFLDALEDGSVRARHWIDHMILRQNEEGKDPIDYDSERDVVVPKEIAAFGTEKAVGVVLETFAINPLGVMSDKTKLVAEYQGREGDSNVMAPFPDCELAVGDVWTIPYSLYLKGADEVTRPYHVVERFRLDQIDEKYATISFKTTLVSIVDDHVVEGALAERLFTGKALFDRELGLAVRTELNFKKSVPGAFGFASFLEYNCQVTEKLDRERSGMTASAGEEATVSEPASDSAEPAAEETPAADESSELEIPANLLVPESDPEVENIPSV